MKLVVDAVLAILWCGVVSNAQNLSLVGAGYSVDKVVVSPGQITTLFVSGLKTVLTQPIKASATPLPTALAGISVTINQTAPKQLVPAPVLAVQQIDRCSHGGAPPPPNVTGDCLITAITVQIPFELAIPPSNSDAAPSTTEAVVTENNVASKAFRLVVVPDVLHVLTTCDSFPGMQVDLSSSSASSGVCLPVVTHADGRMVGPNLPATPGETIVIYAVGLGQTTPAVKTGDPTPTPAPTVRSDSPFFTRGVGLQFDFRVNAGPSRPYVNPTVMRPVGLATPEFVGLTPGLVGLYQINVKLPDMFPPVDPCSATSVLIGTTVSDMFSNIALSNLTISIGGQASFDGAAICVQEQ
jgi:uncharacterized protein (TIGR03437 family)